MSPDTERLRFLARIARKEIHLLEQTTARLFIQNTPLTPPDVEYWIAALSGQRYAWGDT